MNPGHLLLAGWLSIQALDAQTTVLTVTEILARVQTNTGQFEQSLPDFVCDEKLESRRIEHGVLTREVVAESHFAGLQKRSGRMAFTETRELVSINGKPPKPGETLRKVPIFGGGFSSLLDQTFSARYTPLQDYRIAARETFNDRPALVIEFATKPGQQVLRMLFNGNKVLIQRDTGRAWIDEQTLQVLRIERRFLNLPADFSRMVATVDYGAVSIDGKPFWMPLRVKSEQDSKGGTRGEFTAGYTNYRKFEVASGITYQPVP